MSSAKAPILIMVNGTPKARICPNCEKRKCIRDFDLCSPCKRKHNDDLIGAPIRAAQHAEQVVDALAEVVELQAYACSQATLIEKRTKRKFDDIVERAQAAVSRYRSETGPVKQARPTEQLLAFLHEFRDSLAAEDSWDGSTSD